MMAKEQLVTLEIVKETRKGTKSFNFRKVKGFGHESVSRTEQRGNGSDYREETGNELTGFLQ